MSLPGRPFLPAHLPALDGLRGVAIILILLHQLNRIATPDLAARLVELALDFGWVGVQLFFVLSGFLITGILLDSRESPGYLRSFFARRVLRIFPLYFGTLILILGVLPVLGAVPESWRQHQVWYWLYVSNWTQPYIPGKLPHFWSLAVEEQFYVLWPFVVLRLSAAPLLRVCLAISALALVIRIAMVVAGTPPEAIYMFTTSRMDALLLGGAAAALLRLPAGLPAWLTRRNLWTVAVIVGLVGLVATRGYQRTSPIGQTLGYSALALVFAAVILALVLEEASTGERTAIARTLASAPLRTLGTYSYGMYIFHKPLHDLVGVPTLAALGLGRTVAVAPGLAYVAVGIGVVFAAGALSYHLFERHFLAIKARYRPAAAGRVD